MSTNLPTDESPRFLAERAKQLLRLGLAAANMSVPEFARTMRLDSDCCAEKWASLKSDKHVPLWILGSSRIPASVRAAILSGLDQTYSARVLNRGDDLEGESNVVTGIVGNLLAAIAGAMVDQRWSAAEARLALPFATQLLTHTQAFVAMLTERAGLDRQEKLAVIR